VRKTLENNGWKIAATNQNEKKGVFAFRNLLAFDSMHNKQGCKNLLRTHARANTIHPSLPTTDDDDDDHGENAHFPSSLFSLSRRRPPHYFPTFLVSGKPLFLPVSVFMYLFTMKSWEVVQMLQNE
jgi:hypothetical protein